MVKLEKVGSSLERTVEFARDASDRRKILIKIGETLSISLASGLKEGRSPFPSKIAFSQIVMPSRRNIVAMEGLS